MQLEELRYGQKLLIAYTRLDGLESVEVVEAHWLKKMNEASFVFIDEFDAFYHFKLAFEVCKQLFNLNCQVFTSSHNTYLMTNDLLRPDSHLCQCFRCVGQDADGENEKESGVLYAFCGG